MKNPERLPLDEALTEAEALKRGLPEKETGQYSTKEYREARQDIDVEREAEERPARVERLNKTVDRLFPGESEGLKGLREKIKRSLEVPQWGEHHNEGMFMDTHLDLILKSIEDIRNGNFPEGLPEDVCSLLQATAEKHAEALERYTFLHDISKMDCLRITRGDKKIEEVTWEEWRSKLPEEAKADPVAFKDWCRAQGIVGISYYHQTGKEGGKGGQQHGEAGAEEIREMGIDVDPAMLVAIKNHEVAYQFQKASVATYEKHFKDMTDDEKAMAMTASYVDTTASLLPGGVPKLEGFLALAASKRNYEVCSGVKAELESTKGLDAKKIEKALKVLRERKERIEESVEELVSRLEKECRPTEYDQERLSGALDALVVGGSITEEDKSVVLESAGKGDVASLGRRFGKKMPLVNQALKMSEKT